MAKFLTKLQTELHDQQAAQGRGTWRLLSDLQYQSDITGQLYVVPKDFITDYASVPRLPVIFVVLGDIASEAAVIHDFLYRTNLVPRKVADEIFREAALATGCQHWKAMALYLGVRLGGEKAYDRKK